MTTPDVLSCRALTPKYPEIRASRAIRRTRESGGFIFLDQNEIAAKQSHRARNRPSSRVIQLSTTQQKGQGNAIVRPPPITDGLLEHQSICYFIATHVVRSNKHGFLDVVPSLYKRQTLQQLPCLNASIEALALASYAHLSRNAETAVLARKKYADALKFMNSAIADKKDSMSDITLFTIGLLSLYETMIAEGEDSLELTKRHWQGALSLVAAKGMCQLASPFARRNFVQVVTTGIQGDLDIPPSVLDMCRLVIRMLGDADPAMKLWGLILDTYELAKALKTAQDGLGILLARASTIDEGLTQVCHEPPEEWRYNICFEKARPDIIYTGMYHVFPDLGVASIWHAIWLTRMRLQTHIRTILLSDQARVTPGIDKSTCEKQSEVCFRIAQDMSELVLASTPQFLGYICKIDQTPALAPNVELDAFDEVKSPGSPRSEHLSLDVPLSPMITHVLTHTPSIKPYAGYMFNTAIQHAMLTPVASREARAFAANVMRSVAHTMGVGQALVVARMLDRMNMTSPS